jgi:hypothetical protein
MAEPETVEVRNVNVPGQVTRLRADILRSMEASLLGLLRDHPEGLTQSGMYDGLQCRLDEAFFPGGAKSGWWMKAAQLDLEARGVLSRIKGKPTKWVLAD